MTGGNSMTRAVAPTAESHFQDNLQALADFVPQLAEDLQQARPPVSADKLKTLFDRKNMPWQVMTISACYSGALLKDLATDTRLIMTASAEDRQSFGCGDENDFTYFGRAYFKESLTNQGQFVKAFERAKKLVREWEDKEDYQNSQPQIHKPGLILEHLEKWRMQMDLKPELNEAINPARTKPIRTTE